MTSEKWKITQYYSQVKVCGMARTEVSWLLVLGTFHWFVYITILITKHILCDYSEDRFRTSFALFTSSMSCFWVSLFLINSSRSSCWSFSRYWSIACVGKSHFKLLKCMNTLEEHLTPWCHMKVDTYTGCPPKKWHYRNYPIII